MLSNSRKKEIQKKLAEVLQFHQAQYSLVNMVGDMVDFDVNNEEINYISDALQVHVVDNDQTNKFETKKELCVREIENFIDYFTSDDDERQSMYDCLNFYKDEDHVLNSEDYLNTKI